jgi:transcriptional regulator
MYVQLYLGSRTFGCLLTNRRKEIAELRELSSSDRGLADLLDSIRNNMLVVQNDGLALCEKSKETRTLRHMGTSQYNRNRTVG